MFLNPYKKYTRNIRHKSSRKAPSYLDFDKQYEIIITEGIRDLDNEVLSNPMTISFHTKIIEEVGSLSDTRFIDSVIDTDKKRLYAVDRNDGFYIINIEDCPVRLSTKTFSCHNAQVYQIEDVMQ